MYVGEYMTQKVITISPDALVVDAMKSMRLHGIRRLPVVENGRLVGLVTEDTLREHGVKEEAVSFTCRHFLVAKTKVSELMVRNVMTVAPDTTLEDCAALGQRHKIGTLPVVEHGRLVGIITTTDLFKILTQVLGFDKQGVRLHLIGGYMDRPQGELMGVLSRHGALILSMFSAAAPATGRSDIIIHLDTDGTKEIVDDLQGLGYVVEARVHKPTGVEG